MSTAAPIVASILEISVAKLRDRGEGLFRQHYDEIARDKSVMVLDPDWPAYEVMERAGIVLCLGAFVGNELVGYAVTFVYPRHPHYRGLCYAQNDVLYVADAYRTAGVGLQLIRETKREAGERGAQRVFWHAKEHTALATLLPRLGCTVQDIIYSMEV